MAAGITATVYCYCHQAHSLLLVCLFASRSLIPAQVEEADFKIQPNTETSGAH